jgi:hypothetical protein
MYKSYIGVESSVHHTKYPNNTCLSNHEEFIENKQYFSPPTDSIRFRVKNKNLISNLSKLKIPCSSIYPANNSR